MANIQSLFLQQQQQALTLKKLPLQHRFAKLRALQQALEKHESEILQALQNDFRKPPTESLLSEIYPVMAELRFTLKNLRRWAKPKKVRSGLTFLGTTAHIHYEAKGTVLIISPWNYPVLLTLQPLISALAAGNTAMIKPSELTPQTSGLLKKILQEIFLQQEVAVLEGDKELAQELLQLPFDHIFFTGSSQVGQIVLQKAAQNLTPVTLELGGKSPAIVSEDCDLYAAAEKIIWGKVLNLGQTCVAPDYVLVAQNQQAEFFQACLQAIRKLSKGHSFPRVINQHHHARLSRLLQDALAVGGKASSLPAPTATPSEMGVVLMALSFAQAQKAQIMQEEIFGPLLPVLVYENFAEALGFIRSYPRPLALYLFCDNRQIQEQVLAETYSGDVCINDVIIHFANHSLPIGGIGQSGMGQYHGFEGFRTFSHLRSVLRRKRFSFLLRLFYPPYQDFQQKLIHWMIRLGL